MKITKIHIQTTIFISALFLFGLGVQKTSNQKKIINEDISKNLFVTIARIKDSRKYGSSYVYFYNNIKYSDTYSGYGESDSKVGKYFKVEISKKNPQFSRLIIDEEITDSTEIAKSGFRKKTLDEILDTK